MDTRQEIWRVEDGMVCADPGPNDKPPYGDIVCQAPEGGAEFMPMCELSVALWPARAARMCAAINALVGHDETDFAQLVEDALMVRWAATLDPQVTSIEDMREGYRNRPQPESNPES